jgi:UDP-2-acetamido-2-deoxy-ribo-hexuluronate aminotransferase
MEFVDLRAQYRRYQPAIDARLRAVLEHGQYIMGPEVAELETLLAAYVGVRHCVSVASGTVSLEIALRALGIGPGDEVVTVPFSWISSAEVIGLVGATPVFVDIEPDTFVLDPARLEAALTPRTRAVIAVSLFGQMPAVERLAAVTEPRGIVVLEDAAQSFGASRHGRRSCGATLVGSTSFFPAKPLGCYGDGGALFTDDDALAEAMRAIRTHGGVRRHHHTHLGMNARFDTLQAAVLLAKWPWFAEELEARRQVAARYDDGLPPGCVGPAVAPGNRHVWAQYTVRVPAERRAEVQQRLQDRGVPTGVYYPRCFHEQPVFASLGYQWGDFPVSERASREVLSLPMHPFLQPAEQDAVLAALREALA